MVKKQSKYKVLEGKKTDYDIPMFGFKSAFLILISGIIGSILVPMFFSSLGMDDKIANIIGNLIFPGLGIAYSRYFIESKKGICKGFYVTYAIFAISFGIITYFWRYQQVFM